MHKERDSVSHIIRECSLFSEDMNAKTPLVRLNNSAFKENGIKSGDWISITSRINGKTIYRIARGESAGSKGLLEGFIMIDMKGAFTLGVDELRDANGCRETDRRKVISADGAEEQKLFSANWDIKKASLFDRIRANLQHPNRGHRVSMQVAFIGLLLGFLGLVVGVAGLFM